MDRLLRAYDYFEEMKLQLGFTSSDEKLNAKTGQLWIYIEDMEEEFLKIMGESEQEAQKGLDATT